MPATVPISAVFPACDRIAEALKTISVIQSCDPSPDEIIVHVDGGHDEVVAAITAAHPDITVIASSNHIGPGGARNRLVAAATHDWVANFDDDSYPDHPDYFARVMEGIRTFPDMAVLSAASMQVEKDMPGYMQIGIFSGCGCVFSKPWFLKTTGHVPLRVAYCMEEVDMSLQLHRRGGLIVHDPRLHVRHFHELPACPSPDINAGVIANTALLPFLRYPVVLLPLGIWHVFSRLISIARKGWWAGLGRGLALIPQYLIKYSPDRDPATLDDVISWHKLRRSPELLNPARHEFSSARANE